MFASSQGFTSSPSGDAKKAQRQEDKQTCLPITVRALETAVQQRADEGGELRFHGVEAGILLLVGAIESMTKSAQSLEFTLNDGTGRVKVRHYIQDTPPADLDALTAGRYASICGSLRTAPMVHFSALGVQLVRSADEVSYHMIESAHAALKLTKGLADPATPATKRSAVEYFGAETAAPMDITPPKEDAPASMGAAAPAVTSATAAAAAIEAAAPTAAAEPVKVAAAGPLEGTALSKAILDFLQQGRDKEEGYPTAEVCAHFPASAKEEVKKILEELVEDGEIITTLNDDTWGAV